MGQYGNQPDFGTRAVAITPKGFYDGGRVDVSYYVDSKGNTQTKTFTSTNLNVSTLKNGDPIVQAINGDEWFNFCEDDTPCWMYPNFDDSNSKFGKIYNRNAVNDSNFFSEGYTLIEQNVLNDMVNYDWNPYLGQKLKSIPTAAEDQAANGTLWTYNYDEATSGEDTFGFTALPGPIFFAGGFSDTGHATAFWCQNTSLFGKLGFESTRIFEYDVEENDTGNYVRLQVDVNEINKPEPLNSAALYVGTGGDLLVTVVGSKTPVMFKNVPDASFLPIIVSNVWERGDMGITTASDIIAIY